MVRELIAAVRRSELYEDMIAAQRDIHQANPGELGGWQKVFFGLAAFQFFGRHADSVAKAQEQRAVAEHRPRRAFEVTVADFGVNDVDEFLVNLWIVDAGHLAAHQLGRVDRDVAREDPPSLLGPDAHRFERQLAVEQITIKWMMQARVALLYFVHQ